MSDWQRLLGNKLHELRRDRRYTLKQAGERAHIKDTDLSKIERGERPLVTVSALRRLAQVYGVEMKDLVEQL